MKTFLLFALLVGVICLVVECVPARDENTLIFVHGSWHTSDTWSSVTNKLTQIYNVIDTVEVQLPGRVKGDNICKIPLQPQQLGPLTGYYAQVDLPAYVNTIASAIESKKNGTSKLHLIVHSSSGAYVQHALSVMNSTLVNRLSTVLFVASYLTLPNVPLSTYTYNSTELLSTLITPFPNAPMLCVNSTLVANVLYNTCASETKTLASEALVYEPAIPFTTPLQNNLKKIRPRQVYLKTLMDRAIPLALQNLMINEQKSLGNRKMEVVSFHILHIRISCTEPG